MTDELKHLGVHAVKITGQTDKFITVAGWGVVFGGIDLEGDTFTKDTDYQLSLVPVKPVFYDHTLGDIKSALGAVVDVEQKSEDDIDGLWITAQLERSREYIGEITQLVEKGVLGWSSGSVGHLVRRDQKSIKAWPIVEWSLTPTPAEPRTIGAQLLKAIAAVNDQLQVLEQEPGEGSDSTTTHIDAVEDCEIQKTESAKAQSEVYTMTDIKADETPKVEAIDYDRLIKGVSENVKGYVDAQLEFLKAEPVKTAPANLKIQKYSEDAATDAFIHYLKTGRDAGPYKAALQGQEATEGGYLVPDDFYARIIAKRDDLSIARQGGALVLQTSRDVIQVPNENATSSFTVAAEEGAYSESEPTFGQVSITIHKATNLIKVSEELMEDNATNLDGFLAEMLGRSLAAYENNAVTHGTGSGEWQGIYVGGTAALTSDFATTIGAAEVPELFSKLPEPYAPEAVWVMRWATYWNQVMSLRGDAFNFMPTPAGGGWDYQLLGKRVLFTDQNKAFAASQKSICVGNFRFYGIGERRELRIVRNPWLYQLNGQIGIFSSVRSGGAVLQAEAFQYLTNHS